MISEDDNFVIPEWIMNMSLEELQLAIAEKEAEIAAKKMKEK